MKYQEEEDKIRSFKGELSIVNDEKIMDGDNLTIKNMEILLSKAKTSICEIINDNGHGSGFICKIKYDKKSLSCLITNNHVITKFMIFNKNDIEIKIDNEIKKISLKKYRRIWTDESIDFTCIEILKEDNLIEKVAPFEIDDNCYIENYNIQEYNKRGIIIPSIGKKKKLN